LHHTYPQVLNIIAGDDKGTFNVGAHLSSHPDIRKVSFTGSVPTGKKIMSCAARDVKRITLEMGGNDAAIVRKDIDIAVMAPKIFGGAFGNTGQVCCTPAVPLL
jgi:acyl-CoA reductase-like NAD-dependent aldehyde dehydrogenase